MAPNGADVYEPSAAERETLAKRFHAKLTWSMLHDHEKQGLLDEWREQQAKKEPPHQAIASANQQVPRAVSAADFVRLTDAVTKLAKAQPISATATTKAAAHLAVRTVGRVLRPILAREQKERAELQRDLASMRREWAQQSRRFDDLATGVLAELCVHKRDENDERAQRLDQLEARVDAAIAKLARR